MEAFPLLTVYDCNLMYICMKQAWLYYVFKRCDLNSCTVIFVTLSLVVKVLYVTLWY